MNKELKALNEIRELVNSVDYASKIPDINNELDTIEKSLKALEIIKKMFDIEIDLRDEKQSSFLTLYSKGDRKFICTYTIDYDKAKLLKEVLCD